MIATLSTTNTVFTGKGRDRGTNGSPRLRAANASDRAAIATRRHSLGSAFLGGTRTGNRIRKTQDEPHLRNRDSCPAKIPEFPSRGQVTLVMGPANLN